MTVNLSALGGAGQQFFDNNGDPLTGGKLYSYEAGTTTPQVTYTTVAGNVPHSNPIILDAAGRVATGEIWLTSGQNYKFVLKTSTEVTLATWDNITGINGTGIATNALYVQYDPAGAGAIATNVQAKLRETVSVKDFGAVGDGVTDDTAAIQTAVDSVAGNQSIYFPAGIYLVGAAGIAVTNKTGVTLFGEGAIVKITAISTLTTALGATTILFSNCTQSGVRGLEINGNNIASSSIGLNACTECFIDGVTAYSSGVAGQIISAGGGFRNTFTNNTDYSGIGVTRGMWLGNVNSVDMETDIYIAANIVRNNPATGIVVSSVGGSVIGNHIKQNEGSGIVLGGANGFSTKNITVANNYCENNLFHGIQSDAVYSTDADLIDAITVIGNVLLSHNRSTTAGIYILNAQRWTVSGNICINNSSAGIYIGDNVKNITVSGNSCNDTRSGGARTQQIGIAFVAQVTNSYGVAITGNICNNNVARGIFVGTSTPGSLSAVSVVSNICYENSQIGIFMAEAVVGEMSSIVVDSNVCLNNPTFDIRLSLLDVAIGNNRYATSTDVASFNFENANTTPSVAGRTYWIANNTGATSITTFANGTNGQQITIRAANGNTTVVNGATVINKGGTNVVIPGNGIISYVLQGTVWFEAFRSF